MSSQPERTEKTCLNCHTKLVGRFCHVCGQENVVTKQNFWSLVQHFIYDIFHFDGKFFETLKHLLFSPGRVPKEFVAGRRASFLQPVRMYLFTSALFFLIFFSIGSGFTYKETPLTMQDRIESKEALLDLAKERPKDTMLSNRIKMIDDTSLVVFPSDLFKGLPFQINGRFYYSVAEYDSAQKRLPKDKKDNNIKNLFTRKLISLHTSNGSDPNAVIRAFGNEFAHNFPYMLFISLPFFAGILKLLYRKRKDLFYSDHAIFTVYHYIVSFILLMAVFGIGKLNDWLDWSVFSIFIFSLLIWWWVYLFISMKRFYGQSFLKTLLKYLILSVLASIIMLTLFIFFILFTAYRI